MEGQLPQITLADQAGFTLAVRDLFSTPVDAIVNPANSGLSHGSGLAEQISLVAGQALDDECGAIIARQGMLKPGSAAVTTAGLMDFTAVIHAVGPRIGMGDEQSVLEQTLWACLRAAEQSTQQALAEGVNRTIQSVAFPAIGTGDSGLPESVCAQAFANVVQEYIHTCGGHDYRLHDIWLCVGKDAFETFATPLDMGLLRMPEQEQQEVEVGEVTLDVDDIAALEDDSVDEWFIK